VNTKTRNSISLGTAVFVILFVLKLLGQIDMHWFWVLTSWIWVPIGALFAGMFLMFCFGAVIVFFAALAAYLGK
jgi:hypothetical protein